MEVQMLQTPPKPSKTKLPEAKVAIKVLPASHRKAKIELATTEKKRRCSAFEHSLFFLTQRLLVEIYLQDDNDVESKILQLSFDAISTKRQRRPIRKFSRLPVTMAERQAISRTSDPSPPTSAIGTPSQKAVPETPSARTRLGMSSIDRIYLSPEGSPSPNEDQIWTSISSPVGASSLPSSKMPSTVSGARRLVTPSDPLPPATSNQLEELNTLPTPLIRRPKPQVPVPSDRKGKGKAKQKSEISMYLRDAHAFLIQPPPLSVQVSRKALSEEYGLPGMGFLWKSKKKNLPLKFLLPTIGLNPEMPHSPGEPGLLLSCREEMCKDGPWTLFIKANGSKKVRLNYAGEYTCKKVGKMTKEEFSAQDQAVKNAWGQKIATHKKYPVYRDLRARITLRKRLQTEPTEQQIAEESTLIATKNYLNSLSDADVVEAFERGDEYISIVRLECVSYEHEHAEGFIQAQANSHLPPDERKSKRNVKQQSEAQKKKHQRMVVPSSENEDDELRESSDESEDFSS
ncbi:hypothetical protein CPB84DRAFT_1785050 [Gymnopilus junonius]|uniref:DUF6697 domain-containing protein n=1 Tax=Gymnopilus junonius TaxID=109634 RepID=A0A9P5NIN7_GYMJU|nr:hypothetical protein CPB84DRAFT_1785050 [Gymnopilus junonius]